MAGKSCRSQPSAGRDTTGKDAREQMAWYRSTNYWKVKNRKLLERGFILTFLTWHIFWQLGKTQDLLSENCQTLGDALSE
jgi:hypothetical protein